MPLVIIVALIATASPCHSQGGSLDPVKLSPQYYTIRLENERVRVIEYRLKPGQKEVMHSHPPYVVHILSDGKIKSTVLGGATTETTVKKGDVLWRDPVTHSTENIGTTEVHAILVELKRA